MRPKVVEAHVAPFTHSRAGQPPSCARRHRRRRRRLGREGAGEGEGWSAAWTGTAPVSYAVGRGVPSSPSQSQLTHKLESARFRFQPTIEPTIKCARKTGFKFCNFKYLHTFCTATTRARHCGRPLYLDGARRVAGRARVPGGVGALGGAGAHVAFNSIVAPQP